MTNPIVGFIGLGIMGKPMARNLLKAGYSLVIHNRSRAVLDELSKEGAQVAASSQDVATRSEVIISMLPDSPDVELVYAGEQGIFAGLKSGHLLIDMSSISPVVARKLAAEAAKRGCDMLDAPVSGGEIGAINATLSIMVGGNADALARVRPILECMGNPERIVHVGPEPGSGQICKVCNQIAIGGALAGVSEAFALAKKAGVDAARVRQALLGGFAASRVLEVHGERMLVDNYKPGFRAKLYQKDLRLATEAAAANGVSMPATAIVAQLLNALIASGGENLDYAALGTVLFKMAQG
jgi:2-hydroxy-3-oxopropionate reductase